MAAGDADGNGGRDAAASPAPAPPADASTYARFLFDAFDADRNGALCFQVIHELFLQDRSSALCGAGAGVDAGTAAPASPRGLKIAASESGNGINRDKTHNSHRGIRWQRRRRGGDEGPIPAVSSGCSRSQPRFLRQDFVLGLSVLLRGTVQQKLRWAFNLYDINKDGCITKEVTRGWEHPRGWALGTGVPSAGGVPVTTAPLCPRSGDAADHEVHLRHDGALHPARAAGQRARRARGALLPGEDAPPRPSKHSGAGTGTGTGSGTVPAEPRLLPRRRWTGTATAW